MAQVDDTIAWLFAQCERDHKAAINGDRSAYAIPEDGISMPACGGLGRGTPLTAKFRQLVNALCECGTGHVELIDGGVSGDLAWLVTVEHADVKFVHRARPARWDARVTQLFRRTGSNWERFHRHADPLVEGHTLDEVLDLLA